MKIKRLNLWSWMESYASCMQDLPINSFFRNSFEKEKDHLIKNYPYLGKANLPNGCYLTKEKCSFVFNGHEYSYSKDSFKFDLELLCMMENLPSGETLNSLAKTEKKIFGKVSQRTKRMLEGSFIWKRELHLKTKSSFQIKLMKARLAK